MIKKKIKKQTVKKVKSGKMTIEKLAIITETEFQNIRNEFRGEFATVKADITELKVDVAVLKTDVAVLKTDVAVLKTDVAEIKNDMQDGFLKILTQLEKLNHEDATHTYSHKRIDETLDLHDGRIKKLETAKA